MIEITRKIARQFGVVCLLGEITQESVNGLIADMIEIVPETNKPIYLIIDSVGGNLHAALKAYDAIVGLNLNVEAFVIGSCYSAAGIILQACKKRAATPGSFFLPHAHTSTMSIRFDKDVEERMAHEIVASKKLNDRIVTIYRKKLSIDDQEIREILSISWDKYLNAEQAQQLGLIEEVVEILPFAMK